MRRARLRVLTAHELRHSFSSWLDENGCPRSVRIALLGQSRKGVHDRYNHPTTMREWLGKLWEASNAEEAEPRFVDYERAKAGRVSIPAGEKNGRAKLTAADVAAIRSELGKRQSQILPAATVSIEEPSKKSATARSGRPPDNEPLRALQCSLQVPSDPKPVQRELDPPYLQSLGRSR